jgi:hypothetical protein
MADLTSIESPFAARNIPLNATIANIAIETAEWAFMVCSFPMWRVACSIVRGMPCGECGHSLLVDRCDAPDARPEPKRY